MFTLLILFIYRIGNRIPVPYVDVEALRTLPDDALCAELARLPGVGVWTAEMLMTFSLQRPDVISYGDLAIQRGLRMLYRHRHPAACRPPPHVSQSVPLGRGRRGRSGPHGSRAQSDVQSRIPKRAAPYNGTEKRV